MAKHLVFVYGTLKRGQPNHPLFGQAEKCWFEFQGVGETVDHYPLVVASSCNIPFVLAKKDVGERVLGELYHVNDAQLERLDHLEKHPIFYKRIEIPVMVLSEAEKKPQPNTTVQAWCYLLFDFVPELLNKPFLRSYDSAADPNCMFIAPNLRGTDVAPMKEVKM